MNRHKQQSEKAKELIEKLRLENGKSIDIDEVLTSAFHWAFGVFDDLFPERAANKTAGARAAPDSRNARQIHQPWLAVVAGSIDYAAHHAVTWTHHLADQQQREPVQLQRDHAKRGDASRAESGEDDAAEGQKSAADFQHSWSDFTQDGSEGKKRRKN